MVLRGVAGIDEMNRIIEAQILSICIAENIGMHEGVIESRVERGQVIGRAAADLDLIQMSIPVCIRVRPDRIEIERCRKSIRIILSGQVVSGVIDAHKRDTNFGLNRTVRTGVEIDPGACCLSITGGSAICNDRSTIPGAAACPRSVKLHSKENSVVDITIVLYGTGNHSAGDIKGNGSAIRDDSARAVRAGRSLDQNI